MHIQRWAPGDFAKGMQVDQWLIGMLGGLFTILPVFITMIVWWAFTSKYKLVDDSGKIDSRNAFLFNFAHGLLWWLVLELWIKFGGS